MNKKNTLIGAALILLGISIYLRNFRIETGSLVTLFIGLGLLYAYTQRKEEPFVIFGGIFTVIGLMAVIGDLRLFRLNVTFEAVLIVLGLIFIFMYYTRHIQGFIFPGAILPALGVHIILQRSFSDRLAGPSIFLLLGFAFYAIYFMAYMGKSSWPLIPATLLLLGGVAAYGFNFKILTWSMIIGKWDYIGPLLLVAAGVLILLGKLTKGRT